MEKFELSQYQKDIMNYIDSTNSNLLVDAKAGSGKTSTLILVSEKLNQQNQNSIFLSFNKSIVEELQEKLPDSIVKTIHSLGMTFIRSYLYKKHNKNYVLEVDSSGTKLRTLCKEYYDKYFKPIVTEINKDIMSADDLTKLHTDLVNDFISVCNFIRLYGNDYGDVEQVRKIVRKFTNSLAEASDEYLTNYYELVIAVLDKTIELFQNPSNTNSLGQPIYVIDFVDMIYFPVYFNMSIPYSLKNSLDTVLVDETQDLSMLQQLFVSKLNTGNNRFIFVGDKNQSIYAFSGADTHSIDRLKYNFQPKELPLSICYRCPKKIIKLAQQIVPSIEWNPNREDTGHLEAITYTEMKKMLKPNDILIGRRNKDLLKIYKDFTLGDKKQIKFKNKELVNSIIKSLINCIKDYMLLYAKGQNIDKVVYEHMMEFSKRTHYDAKTKEYKNEMNDFIKQYAKEHSVIKTKKPIMKANQTLDYLQKCMEEFKEYGAYEYDLECDGRQYYDIIMEFINEYKAKHVSVLVDDFIYYLKDFLNGSNNYTDVPIISSVHSMKGGEANRVFIYDYPKFPYEFRDMSDDEKQQEYNLQYVAITRAKKELFLMLLDPKDAPNEDMVQWYEDKNKECQQMVKLINQTS